MRKLYFFLQLYFLLFTEVTIIWKEMSGCSRFRWSSEVLRRWLVSITSLFMLYLWYDECKLLIARFSVNAINIRIKMIRNSCSLFSVSISPPWYWRRGFALSNLSWEFNKSPIAGWFIMCYTFLFVSKLFLSFVSIDSSYLRKM